MVHARVNPLLFAEKMQLVGEDRFCEPNLIVDLIPSTSWFVNLRSHLSRKDWEMLRRFIYDRANQSCELCGVVRPRRLEAHERFSYDFVCGVQRLERLLAVCSACHRTTHFAHASLFGLEAQMIAHLRAVRHWNETQADAHIEEAFTIYERRSAVEWTVDLSIVCNLS